MDDYIKRLRRYVAANPILFEDESDRPAMNALFWHYSEYHGIDSDRVKSASQTLRGHLVELSFQENEEIINLVWTRCAEHERISFLAGLQLGAQLMLEITEPVE